MFSSKVVNKLEINGQTTGSIRVCLCKQEVMILINMVVFILLSCYNLHCTYTVYIKIALICVKEFLIRASYYFNHDSFVIEPNIKKLKKIHTMMKKDVRNMMIQAMSLARQKMMMTEK